MSGDRGSARVEGTTAEAVETTEEPAGSGLSLDDFLPPPLAELRPMVAPRAAAGAGMRTARVASVAGRKAQIVMRGAPSPIEAQIAPEVDPELVDDARASGDSVLIELCEGEPPLVVAVLQTRRPREIRLKAAVVHIEGEREVLLRSGSAAVRIREDGDIEIVGSRISAASRGLFRLVGRILRLN